MVLHKAVMVREVMEFLAPRTGDCIIDCTLGCGGHSEVILEAIKPRGRLIGIDQDAEAIAIARETLARQGQGAQTSVTYVQDNFRNLGKIAADLNLTHVDGILFDLGLGSHQLDRADRGFAIRHNAPLDMRMNAQSQLAAFDIVNFLSEAELEQVISKYGQERWARRIARQVTRQRKAKPIETTGELAELVSRAVGFKLSQTRIHPATRTFQAIRIAVNNELDVLDKGLDAAVNILSDGGRICVLAFHSLEDRIVKEKLKGFSGAGTLEILTPKPVTPQEEEIKDNPRARSAKLRAAVKRGAR